MADDSDHARRNFAPPWGPHHKVPTVQHYREEKEAEDAQQDGDDTEEAEQVGAAAQDESSEQAAQYADTSQVSTNADPKTRRKQMKHREVSAAHREVTDPVTHLPVAIRDFTDEDLVLSDEDDNDDNNNEQAKDKVKTEDMDGGNGTETKIKQEESEETAVPAEQPKIDEKELNTLKQAATVEGKQIDINELTALLQKQANPKPIGRRIRPVDRFGKEYGQDRSKGIGLYMKSGGGREEDVRGSLAQYRDAKRIGLALDSSDPATQSAIMNGTASSVFLPPEFANARKDLAGVIRIALFMVVLMIVITVAVGIFLYFWISDLVKREHLVYFYITYLMLSLGFISFAAAGFTTWAQNYSEFIWEDEVAIAAERHRLKQEEAKEQNRKETEGKTGERNLLKRQPETTHWLNSLLGSVWPLINPDLFASVADMLEDIMQASLPSLVRMVSVEDLGQGSEPLRILGIRWLPKGKAAQGVDEEGKTKKNTDKGEPDDVGKDQSGRKAPEPQGDDQGQGDDKEGDTNLAQGMEAEEGDFINMELSFAYRPPREKSSQMTKSAHLYLAFYLPGSIKLPVWVKLQALVGTVRARLQLTPDPPFFGIATITFLGQPRVKMSCVPLVKHGLNLMDVPLISNFVQSAVDAAMAEYVAPKSLTLDLQSMLAGDDFKKDTDARGVFVVRIKHAFDFKIGDMAIPLVKDGSSDSYVSVGWAKLGKPLWSTRVIVSDMDPYWEETAYIAVGPEELDADEKLRIQLWDSDRLTADDDLGRVELDIKMLMRNKQSRGTMWDRTDSFHAIKAGEEMPGRFEWSVGYFPKTKIMEYQVAQQKVESDVKTIDELRTKVFNRAEKKLRETVHDETSEVEQQKEQDFDKVSTDIIANTPPSEDYPSGVLSIQIHQIMGLQLEEQGKNRDPAGELEGGEEKEELLPDSFCTIILNHQKIFKTRTKPKNAQPFFNAVTERFIRDWRTTTVFVSVRDARVHEDNPLLGIVYLPLGSLFRSHETSCINQTFPLSGGIGYGRMRISICFRSVELQLPKALLGWDTYGAVRVDPRATLIPDAEDTDKFPKEVTRHSIKFSTALSSVKMHPSRSSTEEDQNQTIYKPHKRHGNTLLLGVRKRYAASLLVTFASKSSSWFSSLISTNSDKGEIYAILWLHDIPDNEHAELDLPVYIGDISRATANVLPADKSGTHIGKLRVSLKFLPGLDYRVHKGLYKRSQDVRDVVEVIECARDTNLFDGKEGQGDPSAELGTGEDNDDEENNDENNNDNGNGNAGGPAQGEEDDSASSDSASDYGSDNDDSAHLDPDLNIPSSTSKDASKDAKAKDKSADANTGGSIVKDAKAYKHHEAQLHRRHRGLMQWKAPRTLKWVAGKGRRAVESVAGIGDRDTKGMGVETEV